LGGAAASAVERGGHGVNKWQRRLGKLVEPFRVVDGRRFRLSSIDPGDTRGFES
jgi:hypothetical protein